MTNQNSGQHPAQPVISGVPVPPHTIHGIGSPHIELLARLALGGGLLTPFETRELSSAIIAYIEGR